MEKGDEAGRGIATKTFLVLPWPVGSVCCGSNRQIHMDYRNPVEKKGQHGHSLSERGCEGQREPKRESARPLRRQAFIAFLGTLH